MDRYLKGVAAAADLSLKYFVDGRAGGMEEEWTRRTRACVCVPS